MPGHTPKEKAKKKKSMHNSAHGQPKKPAHNSAHGQPKKKVR